MSDNKFPSWDVDDIYRELFPRPCAFGWHNPLTCPNLQEVEHAQSEQLPELQSADRILRDSPLQEQADEPEDRDGQVV